MKKMIFKKNKSKLCIKIQIAKHINKFKIYHKIIFKNISKNKDKKKRLNK